MNKNNKKAKENLKNKIQKELAELIDKNTFNDYDNLRKAAQQFLTNVQILSDNYERGISRNTIKEKITALYKGMREETQYSQKMIGYQHEFETRLNEFLGRKIYLTYVTKEGDIYYYDEANIGKLYKEGTANKGRVNIGSNKIFDANDLTANLQAKVNESKNARQEVYTTAVERYKKNSTEKEMNYKPSEKTFYWWKEHTHILAGWTGKILNTGIIAEGYAGAVINEDPDVVNGKESSLEKLWENYINKDSLGAAVRGDVILGINGNIQFAVKEGSFSTAKIGQYIRLANNILATDFLRAEVLQDPEVFKKMVGTSQHLDEFIEAISEQSKIIAENAIKEDLPSSIIFDIK